MIRNHLGKIAVVGILCAAFLTQPAQAYAWWRGGWGWGWGWPVAGALALGAAATAIWIAGHQYYYYDGVYYDYTPQGYVVVNPPTTVVTEQPVVAAAPVAVTTVGDDVITVNIPNDKGGYTAVTIKRQGNGFVGPQGEYYPEFPKVSQLQLMYGK